MLVVEGDDELEVAAGSAAAVTGALLGAGGELSVSSVNVVSDGEPDGFVNTSLLRTLDGLAMSEVAAAVHQWTDTISTGRAAALHLTGGQLWLNRLGELASNVLGEAATDLHVTAAALGHWVEAHTVSEDWWLITPSLTEALVNGHVMDAFEPGETVDTVQVSDAMVGIMVAVILHVAHVRGWHPYQVLDLALRRP